MISQHACLALLDTELMGFISKQWIPEPHQAVYVDRGQLVRIRSIGSSNDRCRVTLELILFLGSCQVPDPDQSVIATTDQRAAGCMDSQSLHRQITGSQLQKWVGARDVPEADCVVSRTREDHSSRWVNRDACDLAGMALQNS